MKHLLIFVSLLFFANFSYAQSFTGCLIGNTIYTRYVGNSSEAAYQGARFYSNSTFTNSSCGFSFSGGAFNCYVYKGSGDSSQEVNYAGPYPGGTFTQITNCPLDSHVALLFFGSLLVAFRHRTISLKKPGTGDHHSK